MARCLDCGFLYPAWDKEEERDYTQAERKKLREEPQEVKGPRGLGCFRGVTGFPGDAQLRFSFDFEPSPPARILKQLAEDEELIDLLEQEWNCQLFTPHVPGLKPSEHLALQQSRDWEAQQEQACHAWEKAQEEDRQRFQEKMIERQERLEAEQGRLNRRIAYAALIVSIVSVLVSLAIPFVRGDIQFGTESQSSTTAPASSVTAATTVITPTHTVTSPLMPTPMGIPTTSQP